MENKKVKLQLSGDANIKCSWLCFFFFFLAFFFNRSTAFYKFQRLAATLLAVVLKRKTAARAQESPLVILVLHSLCHCNKKNDHTPPLVWLWSKEATYGDSSFEWNILRCYTECNLAQKWSPPLIKRPLYCVSMLRL